jgi:hypothetical protein
MSDTVELNGIEFKHNDKNMLNIKYDNTDLNIKLNKKYDEMYIDCILTDIVKQHIKQIENQRLCSLNYFRRIKENDSERYKQMVEKRAEWYQENKKRLTLKQRDKYNSDDEFKEKLKEKSKRAYMKKMKAERRKKGVEQKKVVENTLT